LRDYTIPVTLLRVPQKDHPSRFHARFPCKVPVELWTHHKGTSLGEGHFLDISVGGALFRCRTQLQKGVTYHFHCEGGLRFDGMVVREHREEGNVEKDLFYGIRFDASSRQEGKIKKLIDALRMPAAEPSPFEERLKTYWG
jgi:hypothetical protein